MNCNGHGVICYKLLSNSGILFLLYIYIFPAPPLGDGMSGADRPSEP